MVLQITDPHFDFMTVGRNRQFGNDSVGAGEYREYSPARQKRSCGSNAPDPRRACLGRHVSFVPDISKMDLLALHT